MALAAILGVNQALYFPARQATVLEMVGRGELASAVALNSIAFNLARVIGPALGGIVIATLGVSACFWLNALSYLGVIVALLTIRRRPLTAGPPQTAIQLIGEALGYVVRTPTLTGLFLLLFLGVAPTVNVLAGVVAHAPGPSAAVWLGRALSAAAAEAVRASGLARPDCVRAWRGRCAARRCRGRPPRCRR